MKRFRIVIAVVGLLSLVSVAASAQSGACELKKFNFVVEAGATCPLNSHGDTSNKIGPQLGLEALWNLRKLPLQMFPIDLGAELYVGSAVRGYAGDDVSNRTVSLSVVSDYNFRLGPNFYPFAGVGLGLARCEQVTGSYGDDAEGTRLCFTPRIGFVAFRHLRGTLDAHITQKDYSHAGRSVGYSF